MELLPVNCVNFALFLNHCCVIIPTLNLYLASMNASAFFMGCCLAAMSLTSLLSAPIYGRITDITQTTKAIVLVSNLFAVGGKYFDQVLFLFPRFYTFFSSTSKVVKLQIFVCF